jgi:Tfp pilus assembly protein PilF/TolB-like protein
MIRKTPRNKDASTKAAGESPCSTADDVDLSSAAERLSAFLDADDDSNPRTPTEAVREEMRRDGIDPQGFSERLKNAVRDAYLKAQSESRKKEETRRLEELAPESDVDWPTVLKQVIGTSSIAELSPLDESRFIAFDAREIIDGAVLGGRPVIGLGGMGGRLAARLNSSHAEALSVLAVPALGSPRAARLDLQALPETDRLGLASTLINMMGTHERLVVRSFNAISDSADVSLSPTEIGLREAADCVLDWGGGVADGRLVVWAQLVKAINGKPLGEKRCYDESLANVYRLSGQISRHIADDLGLKSPGDIWGRQKHRYTQDPEAARSYNAGRVSWNKFTEPDFMEAIGRFEYAIERDQEFAEAYAGLADCYTWMGILNMRSPQDTFQMARGKALDALKRDDGIAEAHTSLAFTEMYSDWNWEGAEARFRHAISLNPNYETAYQGYAQLMMALMRFDEALEAIDQARVIHPRSFIINVVKGVILYEAERFDECIEQFKETIDLNPKFDASYYGHALALEQKGLLKQAVKECRRAVVRSKRNPIKLTALAHTHALLKQMRQARKVLDELNSLRSTHQYVSPFHMALIYARLGETDQAFDFLEQAYRDKDQWLTLLRTEPRLKELRGDSRFRRLVLMLNFPMI